MAGQVEPADVLHLNVQEEQVYSRAAKKSGGLRAAGNRTGHRHAGMLL